MDVANVDSGRYAGMIVATTALHVVQDTGRSSAIIHDKRNLDKIPLAGEKVALSYKKRQGGGERAGSFKRPGSGAELITSQRLREYDMKDVKRNKQPENAVDATAPVGAPGSVVRVVAGRISAFGLADSAGEEFLR
ncbi:hypothetical protein ACFS07_36095 [Undibacterium arcticum]